MCNSLSHGGRRCAAHIQEEMQSHKDKYVSVVLIAAREEEDTVLTETPLTSVEEEKIEKESLESEEVSKARHDYAQAQAQESLDERKYAHFLQIKDENQVAQLIYESSDTFSQTKKDLDKAKHAYNGKLAEIRLNHENKVTSKVEYMESHVPEAEQKMEELQRQQRKLDSEYSIAAEEFDRNQDPDKEYTGRERLADIESQQEALRAELRKANRALTEAKKRDFDNFLATYDAAYEKQKATKQFNEIVEGIKHKATRERQRALAIAPEAIKQYSADPSTFTIREGQFKGFKPGMIAKNESLVQDSYVALVSAEKNVKNRMRREAIREKIMRTPEFSEYANSKFLETKRGREYFEKEEKLHQEFMLTRTYYKRLNTLIEDARNRGDKEEEQNLTDHRMRIDTIRALDDQSRKVFDAKLREVA